MFYLWSFVLWVLCLRMHKCPRAEAVVIFCKTFPRLNDICTWAALRKQAIIITGDLNLDGRRTDQREGKILLDLEEVHDLRCLITQPTKMTKTSETLLDVILTTKPAIFKQCGVINPEIRNHHLIYNLLTKVVHQHKGKTITFRSLKNVDMDLLNESLATAP